jgi:hypothetical protein
MVIMRILLLFSFVLCFLFSCSHEAWKSTKATAEKELQKVVFEKYVSVGVEAVKDSFPDSRIVLHYDSLSRVYCGVGELSEVYLFPMSNGRYLLKRNIDWLKVTQKVANAGLRAINEGRFGIKFFDKDTHAPRDTL